MLNQQRLRLRPRFSFYPAGSPSGYEGPRSVSRCFFLGSYSSDRRRGRPILGHKSRSVAGKRDFDRTVKKTRFVCSAKRVNDNTNGPRRRSDFARHGNKTRKYGNSRGNADNRPETATDYSVVSAGSTTFFRSFVCFLGLFGKQFGHFYYLTIKKNSVPVIFPY